VSGQEQRWYQHFQVESDDRPDGEAFWADQRLMVKPTRKPTREEKLSIILVGVIGIGSIVLMMVVLVIAVYISRR
jgi:preprotein translocase subunit Sss1